MGNDYIYRRQKIISFRYIPIIYIYQFTDPHIYTYIYIYIYMRICTADTQLLLHRY